MWLFIWLENIQLVVVFTKKNKTPRTCKLKVVLPFTIKRLSNLQPRL